MIARKDIIKGMTLVLNQDLILVDNKTYDEKTFTALTELKVTYLSQEKHDPRLTLSDGKSSYFSQKLQFDKLCASLDLHTPANEHQVKLHEKKLNQMDVLKKIKKIASQDNLEQILTLVNDEYFKSIKNVKTLMMYAIQSKGLKILNYGFEHNWFKKIEFNDNVAIGMTVATPLYYAILKSTKEVQQCLIEHGASLSNDFQGKSHRSIQSVIENYTEDLTDEQLNELNEFEAITKEKKHLTKINSNVKPSTKINKL